MHLTTEINESVNTTFELYFQSSPYVNEWYVRKLSKHEVIQ